MFAFFQPATRNGKRSFPFEGSGSTSSLHDWRTPKVSGSECLTLKSLYQVALNQDSTIQKGYVTNTELVSEDESPTTSLSLLQRKRFAVYPIVALHFRLQTLILNLILANFLIHVHRPRRLLFSKLQRKSYANVNKCFVGGRSLNPSNSSKLITTDCKRIMPQVNSVNNKCDVLSLLTPTILCTMALDLRPHAGNLYKKTSKISSESVRRGIWNSSYPISDAYMLGYKEKSVSAAKCHSLGSRLQMYGSVTPSTVSHLPNSPLLANNNTSEWGVHKMANSKSETHLPEQTNVIKLQAIPVLMTCYNTTNGIPLSVQVKAITVLDSAYHVTPRNTLNLPLLGKSRDSTVELPLPTVKLDGCNSMESECASKMVSPSVEKHLQSPAPKPLDDPSNNSPTCPVMQRERYKSCNFQSRCLEGTSSPFQPDQKGHNRLRSYPIHLLSIQAHFRVEQRRQEASHRWRWRQGIHVKSTNIFGTYFSLMDKPP